MNASVLYFMNILRLFFVKDEILCLVAVKNLLLIVLEDTKPDEGLE
jgi:hypothetical protein